MSTITATISTEAKTTTVTNTIKVRRNSNRTYKNTQSVLYGLKQLTGIVTQGWIIQQ